MMGSYVDVYAGPNACTLRAKKDRLHYH